jgi:hypothetical protein
MKMIGKKLLINMIVKHKETIKKSINTQIFHPIRIKILYTHKIITITLTILQEILPKIILKRLLKV